MKKWQERVDEWMSQWKEGYWKPHEMVARLMEEVGEVAREINHQFGPKKKKESEAESELAAEIGDVLFTVICLANSRGIDLDEAMEGVMEKLEKRDAKRWEKKD